MRTCETTESEKGRPETEEKREKYTRLDGELHNFSNQSGQETSGGLIYFCDLSSAFLAF